MKILEIQEVLARKGFTPGPLDGIWGRQTISALRAFQSSVGLEPDGVLGPRTAAALAPEESNLRGPFEPELVWFKEASRLVGTKERAGEASNPVILDWASGRGIPYQGDDIPWCGLFVAHCIASTLDREPIPPNFLSARSWERFGIKTDPTAGALMIFWRKSLHSGLGHVGFYAGEDDTAYRILGGNQSNAVCISWIMKDRLTEARWPATVPPMIARPLIAPRNQGVSWNEA